MGRISYMTFCHDWRPLSPAEKAQYVGCRVYRTCTKPVEYLLSYVYFCAPGRRTLNQRYACYRHTLDFAAKHSLDFPVPDSERPERPTRWNFEEGFSNPLERCRREQRRGVRPRRLME